MFASARSEIDGAGFLRASSTNQSGAIKLVSNQLTDHV